MRSLPYPFVAVLMLCGVACGQDDSTQPQADPSGTWKWEREFNENKIAYTLRLNVQDGKLTGTYQSVFENGPAELRKPVDISEGKIDGKQISFAVSRSFNGNEFTVRYDGKLDDAAITGKSIIDFGNGPQEFDWNAKRGLTAEDVVGKWNVKFEGPNGPIESSFTLANQADKLQGTYHSSFFGDNPIKEAQLKDGELHFTVDFQSDNGSVSIKYTAVPAGDKMRGTIESSFGGQENKTPFVGTRATKPATEAAEAKPAQPDSSKPAQE